MITDLDREIHRKFKKACSYRDFEEIERWRQINKIDESEILNSVMRVEKHLTILCIFWVSAIVGVIATICYTLPYLWPELYH